jgi:hypothetical protein
MHIFHDAHRKAHRSTIMSLIFVVVVSSHARTQDHAQGKLLRVVKYG